MHNLAAELLPVLDLQPPRKAPDIAPNLARAASFVAPAQFQPQPFAAAVNTSGAGTVVDLTPKNDAELLGAALAAGTTHQ